MERDHFFFWSSYWGSLLNDRALEHPIVLFGFENISAENRDKSDEILQSPGTYWGFLQAGTASFVSGPSSWNLRAGQWLCLTAPPPPTLRLGDQSRLYLVHANYHRGLNSMGGPVESEGRLRYIDGCTDTLLYPPPLKGDPCLNLLHFPADIDQTEHFHPSSRSGIIHGGGGTCVTRESEIPLDPGMIFYLPKATEHKFRTGPGGAMDVISFHPQTDWGPTHEAHPMINGTKIEATPP